MAIVLNNGVTNVNGTPGINSDVFANRPAATDVASGSIYIATNTGTIYQSNGATWSTIGGGGGPTPGIDDVLSVNQALTVPQVIEMNGNTLFFQDSGVNAFQFFTDGDFIIGKTGEDRLQYQIYPGYSSFYIEEPTVGANNLFIETINNGRTYKLGDFLVRDNGNCFNILDGSDQIFIQNKGITQGLYFDFTNKAYKFGKLNTGSEHSIEVDELNDFTFTKFAGIVNGFNLDFSATVFQFGYLDTSTNPDTYININGNGSTIQAVYNGNDNGLNINFFPGSRIFQLGDYQGTFDNTKITLDDTNTSILISSNQSSGSTTIEGNQLIFTGANLQSNTSSGSSGEHLVITLNGVVYHIDLKNP